ncbi:YodC family protein [Methylophaga muralis]|uniref:DUF2158 domain-containing protein n=1 Tax=Methylophaga muralis TaxID=291169 RepID=A0A1E3GNS4_9GAMM|nr:DUF2158 domain-containing protein [Methylophaga muralis]ODN65689.1 hypothetical protein A9E74_02535 [Methylophaga muralis]
MGDIKKGDEVQLKSGGPIMTVQGIGDYSPSGPDDGALCIWFDKSTPMEKIFSLATLRKYSD